MSCVKSVEIFNVYFSNYEETVQNKVLIMSRRVAGLADLLKKDALSVRQ